MFFNQHHRGKEGGSSVAEGVISEADWVPLFYSSSSSG